MQWHIKDWLVGVYIYIFLCVNVSIDETLFVLVNSGVILKMSEVCQIFLADFFQKVQ